MRIPKSKAIYVSAALGIALIGGTAATYAAEHKTITVQDNGQREVVSGFTTGSLAAFLKQSGITVSNRDRVTPTLTTTVSSGMVVSIESPKDILFDDGGKIVKISTFAKTVQDFLEQENIILHSGDELVQSLSAKLQNGQTITVHRKVTEVSMKTQTIPFQTIRQRTDNLFAGQQRVLTYGVKGTLDIKTTDVYYDGHKVDETVRKNVSTKPVNQVIEIGDVPQPTELSSRSDTPGAIVGAMTVYATAYESGGLTATGVPAQPGVIAVDPSVIPLGTRVYIPGIGVLRAEDKGSAIIGHRIDICMASFAQACAWGGRTVTIYILG